MTLILDSGAFVALERNDRTMWRRLKLAELAKETPVTHGAVIAQVWRGGGRQALLARAMRSVNVVAVDVGVGRAAGVLLAAARMSDAVDAAVVVIARSGDQIITSDPDDLAALVAASGQRIDVVAA
jgi:hypothetical protein